MEERPSRLAPCRARACRRACFSAVLPGSRQWLLEHREEPLRTLARPERELIDPRTGAPYEVPPLILGGMVFRLVGMPASPGIDFAVQGY